MPYRTPNGACVYIIAHSAAGPCKIGHARSAKHRLAGIQTGNHLELTIWSCWASSSLTQQQLERAAHTALISRHIRGEWYDASVQEIEQAIELIDDIDMRDRALALAPVLLSH